MKNYEVLRLDGFNNCFLIIANTYKNPVNDLLCDKYVPFIQNGDVVFDLAVINGINFNRFVKATIKNYKLQVETIKILSEVSQDILNKSKKYFNSNKEVIQQSALPMAMKYTLLNS